jgi:hypothetical protein
VAVGGNERVGEVGVEELSVQREEADLQVVRLDVALADGKGRPGGRRMGSVEEELEELIAGVGRARQRPEDRAVLLLLQSRTLRERLTLAVDQHPPVDESRHPKGEPQHECGRSTSLTPRSPELQPNEDECRAQGRVADPH